MTTNKREYRRREKLIKLDELISKLSRRKQEDIEEELPEIDRVKYVPIKVKK